jgi:hypothetical protein
LISQPRRAVSPKLPFPRLSRWARLRAAFGFSSFGVPSIDANASRNRLSDNGDSLGAFAGAAFFTGSDVGLSLRIGAKNSTAG